MRSDRFFTWQLSAREHTPNSIYRPHGSGAPLPPERIGWRCTLRTALDASHGRAAEIPVDIPPREACQTKKELAARVRALALRSDQPDVRCGVLDGDWATKDGDFIGAAHHGYFYWEEDGHRTRLHVQGERGDLVSMVVDGVTHHGVLYEDGRKLRWGDGDVWYRLLPESIVDQSVRDFTDSCWDLDAAVPWQNWTSKPRRGLTSGPTTKSQANASWVEFMQSVQSEEGIEDISVLRPSAVFM